MWTERRLRGDRANPWDAAWLVWRYTDDQHFYYLVLKPDGFELGKEVLARQAQDQSADRAEGSSQRGQTQQHGRS
jgi:hypothetical protein